MNLNKWIKIKTYITNKKQKKFYLDVNCWEEEETKEKEIKHMSKWKNETN